MMRDVLHSLQHFHLGYVLLTAVYAVLVYWIFCRWPEWSNEWHGTLCCGFLLYEVLVMSLLEWMTLREHHSGVLYVALGSKVFRLLVALLLLLCYNAFYPESVGMFAVDIISFYMVTLIYESVFFAHRSMKNK
jgi:hypothetical protein